MVFVAADRELVELLFERGHRLRGHVELHHAVIFVGRVLRGRVALARLGDDVDQHRPFLGVADVLEHFDERELVPMASLSPSLTGMI